MYILAPIVFTLGASYLLYGQVDVWKKEVYELELKSVPQNVAKDAIQLKTGVKTKQISGQQAEQLFEGKYGPGASEALQSLVTSD